SPRILELTAAASGGDGAVRRRSRVGELKRWLVVADAPLDRYSEGEINRRLSDIDWVSRAAVAHEAVVEKFIDAPAVLPMKLFTIFGNDQRAVESVHLDALRMAVLVKRVVHQYEWGVRVMLDRAGALRAERPATRAGGRAASPGARYLVTKKAKRDQEAEL